MPSLHRIRYDGNSHLLSRYLERVSIADFHIQDIPLYNESHPLHVESYNIDIDANQREDICLLQNDLIQSVKDILQYEA